MFACGPESLPVVHFLLFLDFSDRDNGCQIKKLHGFCCFPPSNLKIQDPKFGGVKISNHWLDSKKIRGVS